MVQTQKIVFMFYGKNETKLITFCNYFTNSNEAGLLRHVSKICFQNKRIYVQCEYIYLQCKGDRQNSVRVFC